MKLYIDHCTEYRFGAPVRFGLQELRLTPRPGPMQSIQEWRIEIEGGKLEASFIDQHANRVDLVSIDAEAERLAVRCIGAIETSGANGVHGHDRGCAPLWYFRRSTALTAPCDAIKALAADVAASHDQDLDRLHKLMNEIADRVAYEPGHTGVETTASEAMAAGRGVCQDQAHIFLSAARLLGFPARYVSGYLFMPDRALEQASHAWAEANVPHLGWVGFDVANRQCPDEHHVRVASGLDYREAAPVRGLRVGAGTETMIVSLQVQQ